MLESWNFYSSTPDIADMLCLILGSGRTKYDFWEWFLLKCIISYISATCAINNSQL